MNKRVLILVALIFFSISVYSQEPDSISVENSLDTASSIDGHTVDEDNEFSELYITTVPDEAAIIFDGVNKGRSPIEIKDIAAGKHTIVIKKKGHYVKKASINVKAGMKRELKFELIKPARIFIGSNPAGAVVITNNKKSGVTPYLNSKLKPGEHSIVIAKSGFQKEYKKVSLQSGDSDSIFINLIELKDTTKTVVEAEKRVNEKTDDESRLSSVLDKVALGLFLCFSVVIILVELAQQ